MRALAKKLSNLQANGLLALRRWTSSVPFVCPCDFYRPLSFPGTPVSWCGFQPGFLFHRRATPPFPPGVHIKNIGRFRLATAS
eukprot:scaffold61244_cov31-Tisochrysis_lutea.AAC.1